MTDRVPQYPGRVKLVPVSGQTNTFDMTMADEPTQEGTPLNKGTLLSDETAEILGLSGDPTVDDGLMAAFLASRGGCLLKIRATCGGKIAKAGVVISGATAPSGGALITSGKEITYAVATSETTPLRIAATLDLAAVSKTVDTPTGSIVYVDFKLPTPVSGTQTFDTSGVFTLSPYAPRIDICCIGGGGGGAVGSQHKDSDKDTYYNDGSGGGGGFVVNALNVVSDLTVNYTVVVGAAGALGSGASGKAGGTSSVSADGVSVCEASGGGGGLYDSSDEYGNIGIPGGAGNGQGAGSNGSAVSGSVYLFDDASLGIPGGGGGACRGKSIGGAPYGASYTAMAMGPGGGGAGNSSNSSTAAVGYKGRVIIRWSVEV